MPDEITEETAPYMGQIVASRVSSSGTALYGSPIVHDEMICIEIKESKKQHELGRDWYYGGRTVTEIFLSPAQWSDFLTRMNMGDGVPCTFRWKDGNNVSMDVPKPQPIRFGDNSDKQLLDLRNRWVEVEGKIDELICKGKASVKDLKELKQSCAWYRTSGSSTFKFLTDTLIERAEKVMNAVKHEIAAITEHSGLKFIRQQVEQGKIIESTKPKELE